MDGYYEEGRSRRRISLIRSAAAMGAKATVVGFSVSDEAKRRCLLELGALSGRVRILCRDEISASRLQPYARASVELVADVAFLLTPRDSTSTARDILAWIVRERAQGRAVVGVSLHRHLVKKHSGLRFEAVLEAASGGLGALARQALGPVSFVLVTHDLRPQHGDRAAAEEPRESLDEEVRPHDLVTSADLSASEIKGVAGHLEG
ncbi:MAG: hypothetical protein KJ062_12920 [Thermoanaerobaculia bacterium]|nr:hypothetical protein [Thermoanaerobaculia bacterium]